MMQRKAQGISVNVIIIAAIALVVMVILITLVLNSGKNVNKNVNSCESIQGGVCQPDTVGCGDGFIRNPTRGCAQSQEGAEWVCCIPI